MTTDNQSIPAPLHNQPHHPELPVIPGVGDLYVDQSVGIVYRYTAAGWAVFHARWTGLRR